SGGKLRGRGEDDGSGWSGVTWRGAPRRTSGGPGPRPGASSRGETPPPAAWRPNRLGAAPVGGGPPVAQFQAPPIALAASLKGLTISSTSPVTCDTSQSLAFSMPCHSERRICSPVLLRSMLNTALTASATASKAALTMAPIVAQSMPSAFDTRSMTGQTLSQLNTSQAPAAAIAMIQPTGVVRMATPRVVKALASESRNGPNFSAI